MTMANVTNQKVDAYRLLKDGIQFLDLMPGQEIIESEMTETLGVSEAEFREALIRLSVEYLIDIYPQRGTFVALINFGISRECAYMRHILDSEVCTELCKRKANLQNAVEDCLLHMEEAVENKDVIAYLRSDNEFHRRIFRTAGHEMTWEIIADSRAHYNRMLTLDLRRDGLLEKSLNEHRRIVELIRTGERKELKTLLDIHHDYVHMRDREMAIRREFPVYFQNE